FEPKSIHYLHFLDSKNKGVFQARTNVIRTSQSKYIALQDADDISLPNRLQKQIDFLEQNEDVWCVGSHSIKIDEEGNEIGEMTYPPSSDIDVIKMITNKCMNPILDPSVVFRREVFLEIGGYSLRKDRKLVDDFDMWCKSILKNKKFYNIQDKLIKYRINLNGNTLKFKKDMIKQHMMVWREFMREYKGKQE
ncbi:MAG TPA: glycosyltransferase, partial [Candidatus Paceibacterota bacterium]|nr:glycosyltransferase [Candidatus Paceibacterota bacterium]